MPTPQKFERKNFFINRQLQGRYMLSFVVPMLGMLLFMVFTLYVGVQSVIESTTAIMKDDIQEKMATRLQDREETVELYRAAVGDVNAYVRNFSANEKYRSTVYRTLFWVLAIGVLLVIGQIGVLTVFFSHRLAGPIYRLERVCHDLIEGKYDQQIVLRKGDEMQNLATLFNEAMAKTRERLVSLRDEPDEEGRKKVAESLSL
jgi:nitrate/nitrite-specific signal transduction histidine kinase